MSSFFMRIIEYFVEFYEMYAIDFCYNRIKAAGRWHRSGQVKEGERVDVLDAAKMRALMSGRAWFYRVLARCLFVKPDREAYAELLNSAFIAAAGQSEALPVREFFAQLAQLRTYGDDEWNGLAQEYIRLFEDAAGVLVCPWESVYLSREHILFDEHTLAVQEFYEAWGVTAADRKAGPADHIGIECSFLAYLAENAARDCQDGEMARSASCVAAQLSFIECHPLRFMARFCRRLAEISDQSFYRALADFLEFYMEQDAQLLRDLARTETEGS